MGFLVGPGRAVPAPATAPRLDRAGRLAPGDVMFFDSLVPHRSGPNTTPLARRALYITYNRVSAGDQRGRYYRDKRQSYPPDCERDTAKQYVFRV